MKTFLHYTKEKELDEGLVSALGGSVGSVVSAAQTGASVLTGDKAQTIGALMGGKTGKFTDTVRELGGMKEKARAKRYKCKKLKTIELPRAQKELQKAQNSGSSEEENYWTNELSELRQEIQDLNCP